MTIRRVPAEWEPQRCVWLAWPHNRNTWPGRFEPIGEFYRRLIRIIADAVDVHVIGDPKLQAEAAIESIPNVHWFPFPTNDAWVRDYGPTFVLQREPVEHDKSERHGIGIDWNYNAWGGKYPPWDLDDAVAAQVCDSGPWQRVSGNLCVEGGALEWDGQGTLLTTDCLLTTTRNPRMDQSAIEDSLRVTAGAQDIVWVNGGGLEGDDTDGHIDQLARFIDPETVVVAVSQHADDPNREGLEANVRILERWGQSRSPNVSVHRLPIPPRRTIDGQRVPESYCNFLRVGPDRMLVPTFGNAEHDQQALEILRSLASARTPDVEVIGIDCRDLVWGLGAIHCASLNEPMIPIQ